MLFMYSPFKDEEELNKFFNKLNRPSVIEVVTSKRSKVESYETIVEDAFERLIVKS